MRQFMRVSVSPLAFTRSCAMLRQVGGPLKLLASRHGGQVRSPTGFSPGPSHVGIVLDDAACGRVFSGYSRFPLPRNLSALHRRISFHVISKDDGGPYLIKHVLGNSTPINTTLHISVLQSRAVESEREWVHIYAVANENGTPTPFIGHTLDDSRPIADLQGKQVASAMLPGVIDDKFESRTKLVRIRRPSHRTQPSSPMSRGVEKRWRCPDSPRGRNEADAEQQRNARGGGYGTSPRKPAGQWHRPALFSHEQKKKKSESGSARSRTRFSYTAGVYGDDARPGGGQSSGASGGHLRRRLLRQKREVLLRPDAYKTPYDRVKRCRERDINIKASERVNARGELMRWSSGGQAVVFSVGGETEKNPRKLTGLRAISGTLSVRISRGSNPNRHAGESHVIIACPPKHPVKYRLFAVNLRRTHVSSELACAVIPDTYWVRYNGSLLYYST
ncbi:hypothetical protein PR048_033262 [Dryococelus australis]|uniref:Uncharacterized protein n=1 Tax=Dryococelus australis TaxID=614101 RepID=A0ABQ9G402_9NEOP|nr:hypothetical protein PR048_033262 [Dryococelus australis]